jgi:hypothetical protein
MARLAGSTTIQITDADTQFSTTVTFNPAFTAKPAVICSLGDTGPMQTTAYLDCCAWAVSATGFTAVVKKRAGASSGSQNVVFSWIAM